jgi:hypothetical protein
MMLKQVLKDVHQLIQRLLMGIDIKVYNSARRNPKAIRWSESCPGFSSKEKNSQPSYHESKSYGRVACNLPTYDTRPSVRPSMTVQPLLGLGLPQKMLPFFPVPS